ncbi:MAG: MFS transporter, partial [Pseudobdellovibrionaceae bacterium]
TILLLSFSMGMGVALNGPAYQTVLSELVPPEDQQNAILIYYMGLNITRVIGPALGGFVLGFAGASSAFFVNAMSFFGLIIYYWRWPLGKKAVPIKEKKGLFNLNYLERISSKDWKIIFSIHNLKLWAEIFAVSFAASALWALYPVRGRLELGLGSLQYGSLLGCLGLGAFLSAVFSKHVMNPQRNWQSLSFSYLVFAGGEILLGFADNYPMACIAMVLAGIGWIILATLMNMSTRQLTAASHLKASLLGAFLSIFYFGMALGSVIWGSLAKLTSSSNALFVSSGALLLLSILKYYRKK